MSGVRSSDRILCGIRVRIAEAGSGVPLVLVHGLGGSQMWQYIAGPLSENFRVIMPDLPGFGESACPLTPWSTADYVDALRDLFDVLELAQANLAGISYGGEISSLFCSRNTGRVEKLVLIASTGFNDPRWIAMNDIRWAFASTLVKHTLLRSKLFLDVNGSKSFHNARNRPDSLVDNFHRQLQQAGKREAFLQCVKNISCGRAHFAEDLQRITVPTCILWGEQDCVVPPTHASLFRENVPNAVMRILGECGHSVPLEKPEELTREIVNFVCTGSV